MSNERVAFVDDVVLSAALNHWRQILEKTKILDTPWREEERAIQKSETHIAAAVAATCGAVLEWFDYVVFGYFIVIISKQFFPGTDGNSAMLLAAATFGAGVLMRPVGGIILGTYADKRGRKSALLATIALMAVGTGMIGFLPTYSSIGVLAPILILLARLMQGFSAGGELGSATAFMVESAPAGKRNFYASMQNLGQGLAFLLGSVFAAVITNVLSESQIEAWGWRVPFIFGLIIGPVGMYIRRSIPETTEYQKRERKVPLWTTITKEWRAVVLAFMVTVFWTVAVWTLLIYMPAYMEREWKISSSIAFTANCVGLVPFIVLTPAFGYLADKIGARVLMISAAALMLVLTYPLLLLIQNSPTFLVACVVQIAFGIIVAMYAGPAPGFIADLFPAEVRATGMALGYNLAVMAFGGFATFFATLLITLTGNKLAVGFYVMGAAILSLVALLRSAAPPNRGNAY